jgi:hypothetical protein
MVPGCRHARTLKRTVRIYWPARAALTINRDAWTVARDLMSIASMLLVLSLQVAIYSRGVSAVVWRRRQGTMLAWGVIDRVPGMP